MSMLLPFFIVFRCNCLSSIIVFLFCLLPQTKRFLSPQIVPWAGSERKVKATRSEAIDNYQRLSMVLKFESRHVLGYGD